MAESFGQALQAEVREEILSRLRRAEGQLRGIQKMIADGRGCQDVLLQLAAVKAAVVQTAMTILSTQLIQCIQDEAEGATTSREARERFMEVFKKFS
ncbi:MAG: metal-sensitive transcriptional regulator [Bacteroidota bacterium]